MITTYTISDLGNGKVARCIDFCSSSSSCPRSPLGLCLGVVRGVTARVGRPTPKAPAQHFVCFGLGPQGDRPGRRKNAHRGPGVVGGGGVFDQSKRNSAEGNKQYRRGREKKKKNPGGEKFKTKKKKAYGVTCEIRTRACEHNGLAVHPLNHSGKVTYQGTRRAKNHPPHIRACT